MKDEVCPKCCSQDVGVWGFNSETVDYECNRCRHKWVGSREFSEEIIHSCHGAESYKEREGKKLTASCLEEFCRKFKEHKDRTAQVWPYVPRRKAKQDNDFCLIVESGHVKYEVGLPRILFISVCSRFLRRWVQPPILSVFDLSPTEREIRMFENFARGLSRYLTEKGCHTVAKEIQLLDRTPKGTVGDADLKIAIHMITEYC